MPIQEKNVLEFRILSHLLEFAIHLLHKECQYIILSDIKN